MGSLPIIIVALVVYEFTNISDQRNDKVDGGTMPKVPTPVDAIIVLGGGQTAEGQPSAIVVPRLDLAADMYFAAQSAGEPSPTIIVGSRGTPHKPSPHDGGGFEIDEADGSARYLMRNRSVPDAAILEEQMAFDTIGNAYFARVLHADILNLRRLAVITSAFHMPRARVLFDHIFALPATVGGDDPGYVLSYHETSDAMLPPRVIAARRAKEAAAVPRYSPGSDWALRLRDMRAFHRWLYSEHMAYAAGRLEDPGYHRPAVNQSWLESYRI